MRWFLIFSDCNVKFCIQLLVIFYVLKCKITTTLCILLLPQLFTFANSLNTLFRRGLLKFYWTAKNTMAFFLKCTHLRYPFRMHEISIGQGLEVLKDVNLRLIGFVWGKIQARLLMYLIQWVVLSFDVARFPCFHLLYIVYIWRGGEAHKEKDKLCCHYADYNRSLIKIPK